MLKILIKQSINRESTGLKHLNDSKPFIECSNDLDDIYKKWKNTIQIRNAK